FRVVRRALSLSARAPLLPRAAPLASTPAIRPLRSGAAISRAAAAHRARVGGRTAAPLRARAGRGLQQLQRLHVDQVLVLADDVGVPHRLEELLGAVELAYPDHHASQPLGDVAVGARARD